MNAECLKYGNRIQNNIQFGSEKKKLLELKGTPLQDWRVRIGGCFWRGRWSQHDPGPERLLCDALRQPRRPRQQPSAHTLLPKGKIYSPDNKPSSGRQYCRSVKFWHGSGFLDPYLWLVDPDADPDPAIFVSDLKDVKKLFFFIGLFAYYYFKVHLHHFSMIKSHKEVAKQ